MATSNQAMAAKEIRKALKASFPTVKFAVRSRSYAGGSSVDIDWTDGPTTSEVDKIVNRYEYGHFNGMEDIYEYSNVNDDIPQVKYVMTQRGMSEGVRNNIATKLANNFGLPVPVERYDTVVENAWWNKTGRRSSDMIYQEFAKTSF